MRFLVFCAFILGAGWLFSVTVPGESKVKTVAVAEARTAEALVAQLVSSEKAGLQTQRKGKDNGRLVITYSLDPWGLTVGTLQSTYLSQVRSIVPKVFERFPDVDVIEVRGTATFTDQRGHKSNDEALMVTFFRSNAATVNWENVRSENIMKIADASMIHPGLLKHLDR